MILCNTGRLDTTPGGKMASIPLASTSLGPQSKVNRICFRGDLRPPTDAWKHELDADRSSILPSPAMAAKESGGPTYRPAVGKVGDADSDSGVCVTPRFTVAPLFPIQSFPWTWIYVVYVDRAYNTKMRQVLDSQTIIKQIRKGSLLTNVVRYATLGCVDMRPTVDMQQAADIMWALFGDELIVDSLPTTNVIAAIKCKRIDYQSLKSNYKTGIRYELVPPIVPNIHCTLPQTVYEMGLGFLSDELRLHPTGTTPALQTGFHQSTPKAVTT